MVISRIFYLSVIIGICAGVSLVYLANGLLGYTSWREVISMITIIGGVGNFALLRIRKKLKDVWDFQIVYPLPSALKK